MTDGETTWTYTYNANGLRTKRTDGTDTYTYAYYGGVLRFMERNGVPYYFTTAPDGTPMGIVEDETAYYYVTNLQGDVIGIVEKTTGQMVVTYTYDAWGNVLSITGSMADTLGTINPIRYRGYVYDTETGLYYLQTRYYNPETGRFLNADGYSSTGQGILGNNMFAYCNNNPVIYMDWDGCLPDDRLLENARRYAAGGNFITCGSANNNKNASKAHYEEVGGKTLVIYDGGVTPAQMVINNPQNVIVYDYRGSADPNMQILGSFQITDTEQQREIAKKMIEYNNLYPVTPAWDRSLDSLIKEWEIHNYVYKMGFLKIILQIVILTMEMKEKAIGISSWRGY